MEKLSPQDEVKLIKAVEDAVVATKSGMSPNVAIQKVAEQNGYTPPFIDVIVGAFNKSKAVHEIMNGNSNYDLADTRSIVKSMYEPTEEKVACQLPKKDFSALLTTRDENLEKVASDALDLEKYRKMPVHSLFNLIEKCASVCKQVEKKLKSDVIQARIHFDKSIDKAASTMRPMMDFELVKVAQAIVNAYPRTGQKMLTLLFTKLDKDIPVVEKTAFAAVFPLKEPYVAITNAYEHASKLAKAENAIRLFEKDAAVQDYVNLATGDVVGLAGHLRETLQGKPENLESKLSPEFYNRLKTLDAKKKFLDLALYDKDLQQYNFRDLVASYNQVAQSVPEAVEKPAILRNMMLRNLETGGIKDPFELSSEIGIGKLLTEIEKNKQQTDFSKKLQLFPPRNVEKPEDMIPKVERKSGEKGGILAALFESEKKEKREPKENKEDKAVQETHDAQVKLANRVIRNTLPEINNAGITAAQAKTLILLAMNDDLGIMAGKLKGPNGPMDEAQLKQLYNTLLSRYQATV